MKTLLAAIIFVGVAVLLLGVNIFFFHRPFPDGEISTNPEMRKQGIKCAKQEVRPRRWPPWTSFLRPSGIR